jgi:adenylate cyclase class 2
MDKTGVSSEPLEIEKKYRLPPEVRSRIISSLQASKAHFVGDDSEENTIYGGTALDGAGCIIRIRRTQDRSILTFKRRLESKSDIRHQVELESEISDPDSVSKILLELGLTPKLVYEKRRSVWNLGPVEVDIDELPFGSYMEIEGPMADIIKAEKALGIEDLETEHETYPRLTSRLGKKVGDVIEARFD